MSLSLPGEYEKRNPRTRDTTGSGVGDSLDVTAHCDGTGVMHPRNARGILLLEVLSFRISLNHRVGFIKYSMALYYFCKCHDVNLCSVALFQLGKVWSAHQKMKILPL